MQSSLKAVERPLPITIIVVIQGALSLYSMAFGCFAALDPRGELGFLRSAIRLLVGRTDYHSFEQTPQGDFEFHWMGYMTLAVLLALYGACTSWGLWKLKRWARHSVISEYGMMLILWVRSFFAFAVAGGFSSVPEKTLQPIYIVIFVEAMICLTLLYSGGVAEAFGEQE